VELVTFVAAIKVSK